jgi:hypothetical protein
VGIEHHLPQNRSTDTGTGRDSNGAERECERAYL